MSEISAKSNNTAIRAVFSCSGSPIDDITIDLVVDENRNWIEGILAAGWWGKPDSNDVWPFLLKEGGVLDFGSGIGDPASSDERFGSLAITGKSLAKGKNFHFSFGDISANLVLIQDDELSTLH